MGSRAGPGHLDGAEDLDAVLADVADRGVGVLRHAFDTGEVDEARRCVLANSDLLKNTRPTPSSGHLAGFHRFPTLEPLHMLLTGNQVVNEALDRLLGPGYRTIGLSDITVNRSQPWHKDLLRGRFRRYLGEGHSCEDDHGKVFKVILYLQDSTSLQVIAGSQRRSIPLDGDESAIPDPEDPVTSINASRGDAVILDICTTHRGSDESAFGSQQVRDYPRILISTVFGRANCEFSDRMELGNAKRLSDWARRNR